MTPNPLARPLMQLLEALEPYIKNDAKARAAYADAIETHAKEIAKILPDLRAGEKLQPVLMLCQVNGFTPEDYAALTRAIAKKTTLFHRATRINIK